MAVDLWPYSGRNGGAVTDQEHEQLWQAFGDGIPPGQPDPSNVLKVDANSTSWTVQPGRILVQGHVINVTGVESGDTPSESISSRDCLVVAEIDRSTAPWTYAIKLVLGVVGAGRPGLQRSPTVRYQVAIGGFTVQRTGQVVLFPDERPFIQASALRSLPPTVEAQNFNNENIFQLEWRNGTTLCDATFTAPPSGRVRVTSFVRGSGSSTGNDPGTCLQSAFSIRETSSAGGLIWDNRLNDGPSVGGPYIQGMEGSRVVDNLTPGQTYYIRMSHRSSNDGVVCSYSHRRLIIEPLS